MVSNLNKITRMDLTLYIVSVNKVIFRENKFISFTDSAPWWL